MMKKSKWMRRKQRQVDDQRAHRHQITWSSSSMDSIPEHTTCDTLPRS